MSDARLREAAQGVLDVRTTNNPSLYNAAMDKLREVLAAPDGASDPLKELMAASADCWRALNAARMIMDSKEARDDAGAVAFRVRDAIEAIRRQLASDKEVGRE